MPRVRGWCVACPGMLQAVASSEDPCLALHCAACVWYRDAWTCKISFVTSITGTAKPAPRQYYFPLRLQRPRHHDNGHTQHRHQHKTKGTKDKRGAPRHSPKHEKPTKIRAWKHQSRTHATHTSTPLTTFPTPCERSPQRTPGQARHPRPWQTRCWRAHGAAHRSPMNLPPPRWWSRQRRWTLRSPQHQPAAAQHGHACWSASCSAAQRTRWACHLAPAAQPDTRQRA